MRRRMTKSMYRFRRKGIFTTRRTLRPKRTRPEVKFMDIAVQNHAIAGAYASTASANLVNSPSSHILYNNVLTQIIKGTDYYNRIGSRIFVKNIVLYTSYYICPESTEDYNYVSVMARFMCGSWITSTASETIQALFGADTNEKMTVPLNRKLYTIHMDKRVSYNASWAINRYVTAAVPPVYTQNRYGGLVKFKSFNIPVNRSVTYDQQGRVKEDYNVYSFAVFSQLPNMQSNTQQHLCGQYFIRMYFTDM